MNESLKFQIILLMSIHHLPLKNFPLKEMDVVLLHKDHRMKKDCKNYDSKMFNEMAYVFFSLSS